MLTCSFATSAGGSRARQTGPDARGGSAPPGSWVASSLSSLLPAWAQLTLCGAAQARRPQEACRAQPVPGLGKWWWGVASNVPRKAKSNKVAKGPDFSSVSAAALRTQNCKRILIAAVATGRQGSQVRTTSHQAWKTSESGVRKAAEDTAFQRYRKKDGGTRMEPNCRARKQK